MSNSNSSNGGLIHVNAYTRSDGTQVDEYWRHANGGGSFAAINSNNFNVSKTVSNVLNTVGDNKSFEQECPALTKLFGAVNKASAEAPAPDPTVILKGGIEVVRVILDGAIEVGKVAIKVLEVAVPAAAAIYATYLAGKSVYNKVSDFFHSPEAQVQIKTLNTSIQGLRETQRLQKKNIYKLSEKAASTKDKNEYSNLLKELEKLNNQYQKNETLIAKIEHSAQQQDYASVVDGLKKYSENQNIFIDDPAPLKSSAPKSFLDSSFDYPEQEFAYKWENAHRNFGDNSFKPIHALSEPQSLPLEELQSIPDNSLLKEFLDQNNRMKGATGFNNIQQSFLPDEVHNLYKTSIGKTDIGPLTTPWNTPYNMFQSPKPFGDGLFQNINNYLNVNNKDARDLMNIALNAPKNTPDTNEWKFISSDLTNKVNESLGLKGNQQIPADWDGFVFEENSSMSKALANSTQLKGQIQAYYNSSTNKFYADKIPVNLNKDKNLNYSIGHGTVINPKIDSQGNFTGVLFDKYDYEYWDKNKNVSETTRFLNNTAYWLQKGRVITNYYVLIPLKFSF